MGVQRWDGEILVHVSEALESKLATDELEREETTAFETIADVRRFLCDEPRVDSAALRPRKGQRIFSPAFR